MADTTSEVIAYYQELLLSQYVGKPKAYDTIGVIVANAVCDMVLRQVQDGFNIDSAVGAQLDVIGKYVGFKRRVIVPAVKDFHIFADYDTPLTAATGFTDYDGTQNTTSTWYRYTTALESFADLDDEDYRFLLELKIVLNGSDNTMYSISQMLYNSFGTDLACYDQLDMSVSYAVNNAAKKLGELALSQNALPKPMGVKLNELWLAHTPTAIWGLYDVNDDIVVNGWADSTIGFSNISWLRYQDKLS